MVYGRFAASMCYYGLAQNTAELPGDTFLSFLLSGLSEMPGYLLCIPLMEYWGYMHILHILHILHIVHIIAHMHILHILHIIAHIAHMYICIAHIAHAMDVVLDLRT